MHAETMKLALIFIQLHIIIYCSCLCFSNMCLDLSTDCYSAAYEFYYSCLCFSNACL